MPNISNATQLRHRIIIQQRPATVASWGNQSRDWVDYLNGIALGAAKPISAITAGSNTLLSVAAHGWAEGAMVALSGITGAAALNATFGVLNPAAGAFSVAFDSSGLTLGLSSATATQVSGMPCAIEPLSARELMAGQALQSEATHKITMRYCAALNVDPRKAAGWRAVFVHGPVTRIFNIQSLTNVGERNHWVELLVAEGMNQG